MYWDILNGIVLLVLECRDLLEGLSEGHKTESVHTKFPVSFCIYTSPDLLTVNGLNSLWSDVCLKYGN